MITGLIIVFLLFVLFLYMHMRRFKKPDGFPPGPPSLPVYGAFWIVLSYELRNLARAFLKLGEKYNTKVLGLYLGSFTSVIINDPALIKEMLNRAEFDGRLDTILNRLRSYWKKLGIFFTDDYFWFVQRRFALRYARDYGFGRRDQTLENVVEGEIKEMIDMRLNGPKYPAEEMLVKGELIYLPHYFAVPFINGLLQVFGRTTLPRAKYEVLWKVARGSLLFQRSSDDIGGALSLTPWLKNICPNWIRYNALLEGNNAMLNFFEDFIKEVVITYDDTHTRHFLDLYIKRMKEEQAANQRTTFSQEQLALICTDFMLATASAVEAVLTILVERLLIQPEIQEKIHEEIDRVVGRGRLPTLDDRRNMPYTEACIRETMRYDTIVPLGVAHRSLVDTHLGGYFIPKNSLVSANYLALHMNQSIWGDPENFRPERFIIDGKISATADKSLPFGAGRRLCAGETYARQTMFQVFSGFMQEFKVSTVDGKSLKNPAPRIQGIITTIPNFWVRAISRS